MELHGEALSRGKAASTSEGVPWSPQLPSWPQSSRPIRVSECPWSLKPPPWPQPSRPALGCYLGLKWCLCLS